MAEHEAVRLLILGGTNEGTMLGAAITRLYPEIDLVTSLTDQAESPEKVPGRLRVGTFKDVQELVDYLRAEKISGVIDATHPFAASISRCARRACETLDIPRLMMIRPEWVPQANDQWIDAADLEAAVAVLPALGQRVFLALGGRKNLAAFSAVENVHFVVRLAEEPTEPLPLQAYTVITGEPPFNVEDERRLLSRYGIDAVVSMASGGKNGAPKLIAARMLGLPVLMIRRPRTELGTHSWTILAAVKWVKRLLEATAK